MAAKAMVRQELLQIILVAIIIVLFLFIGSGLYAASNQSTSESFRLMADYLREFISSTDDVSEPKPYFIDQGYFLMACPGDKSALCICGKDQCEKTDPLSKQKFEGSTFEIIGNKIVGDGWSITGDPSWGWGGHRLTQNVVFKRVGSENKKIQIIDCSTKEYKDKDECSSKHPEEGEEAD